MHKELIEYLREHAMTLVRLARRTFDAALATELEGMAIELFERASALERDTHF